MEPLKGTLPAGKHPDLQAGIELGLAAVSHQQGKLDVAEKLYREVINFCGQNNMHVVRAWIGLGAIHWHSGRKGKANDAWKKSLRTAKQISKAAGLLVEISIKSCRADPRMPPL